MLSLYKPIVLIALIGVGLFYVSARFDPRGGTLALRPLGELLIPRQAHLGQQTDDRQALAGRRILPRVLTTPQEIKTAVRNYNYHAGQLHSTREKQNLALKEQKAKGARSKKKDSQEYIQLVKQAWSVVTDEQNQLNEQERLKNIASENIKFLRKHGKLDEADELERSSKGYFKQWRETYKLLKNLDLESKDRAFRSRPSRNKLQRRSQHQLRPRVLDGHGEVDRAIRNYVKHARILKVLRKNHQRTIDKQSSKRGGQETHKASLLQLKGQANEVALDELNQLREQARLHDIATENVDWLLQHGRIADARRIEKASRAYFEQWHQTVNLFKKVATKERQVEKKQLVKKKHGTEKEGPLKHKAVGKGDGELSAPKSRRGDEHQLRPRFSKSKRKADVALLRRANSELVNMREALSTYKAETLKHHRMIHGHKKVLDKKTSPAANDKRYYASLLKMAGDVTANRGNVLDEQEKQAKQAVDMVFKLNKGMRLRDSKKLSSHATKYFSAFGQHQHMLQRIDETNKAWQQKKARAEGKKTLKGNPLRISEGSKGRNSPNIGKEHGAKQTPAKAGANRKAEQKTLGTGERNKAEHTTKKEVGGGPGAAQQQVRDSKVDKAERTQVIPGVAQGPEQKSKTGEGESTVTGGNARRRWDKFYKFLRNERERLVLHHPDPEFKIDGMGKADVQATRRARNRDRYERRKKAGNKLFNVHLDQERKPAMAKGKGSDVHQGQRSKQTEAKEKHLDYHLDQSRKNEFLKGRIPRKGYIDKGESLFSVHLR